MTSLFLFGTLRHRPLLEAVLGRSEHLSLMPARLPGYAVLSAGEGPFPTIESDSCAIADGVLVKRITPDDMARLDYYESAFGYQLVDVTLEGGQEARAYFPPDGQRSASGPWTLSAWERDWAELSVFAACEVMSYLGEKPPQEVGALFPMIRARAWARLNAAKSRHGALTMSGAVDILEQRRPYSKYFALEEYELRHARFDGTMTPRLLRAVFRAPDAALVLPYDPYRDRVLLVEQMRMGPLARGDRALWQLEPIAGRLDPGEQPEDAVRREAREEAGLELGALEQVAETYCSPGNSSEFYFVYVGLADLPDSVTGIGGVDDEDEDIRSHVVSFDRLMELCDSFQVGNAPLVLAAYWLARHRGRLREKAGVR
jgi:nudix-type nucleoside diphosphatase (YffH/AdpP family)